MVLFLISKQEGSSTIWVGVSPPSPPSMRYMRGGGLKHLHLRIFNILFIYRLKTHVRINKSNTHVSKDYYIYYFFTGIKTHVRINKSNTHMSKDYYIYHFFTGIKTYVRINKSNTHMSKDYYIYYFLQV